MPRRDDIHEPVKRALIADGWTITDDPYQVFFGIRRAQADIGAWQATGVGPPIGAAQGERRIAVEVKQFRLRRIMTDLAHAVGQYLIYRSWMSRLEPDRDLYLAISNLAWREAFHDISGQVLLQDYGIRLVVIDLRRERITQWIH